MKKFASLEAVLDFAIAREEEAAAGYEALAHKSRRPGMRAMFLQFAKEEKGHRAKLLKVKSGKKLLSTGKKVADLKIGDYLVEVEPTGELDFQQALIFAMKKEKAAFKLYHDLSDQVEDAKVKKLFLDLAQEEAKHKLRFEIESDEMVLKEN
jgi:rubrerythrin